MSRPKDQRVIEELKRIAAENDGLLQPEAVVERARPASSPLHNKFTWDDSEAARQHRIWQARQLIRVSVEVLEASGESFDVFVSLSPDRERESGGYRVVAQVLSDTNMRAQMLADALSELESFREKYRKLQELDEVFSAIGRVRRPRRRRGR